MYILHTQDSYYEKHRNVSILQGVANYIIDIDVDIDIDILVALSKYIY